MPRHTAAHVLTCPKRRLQNGCTKSSRSSSMRRYHRHHKLLSGRGRERPYLGSVKRRHIRAPVAVLPPVPEQIPTVHEVECVVKEPIQQQNSGHLSWVSWVVRYSSIRWSELEWGNSIFKSAVCYPISAWTITEREQGRRHSGAYVDHHYSTQKAKFDYK